jgi:type II secretory pathway pseudopilin PulG
MWTADRERGDTLLELVVAVAIMSVALVAILGAFATAILISGIHRQQATASAYVRSYAEAIENEVAASPSGYKANCAPGYASGFTVPAGYSATITAVSFWNGSAFPSGACNAASDLGVQRVSLRVASANGRAAETLDVILRRTCSTAPLEAACV